MAYKNIEDSRAAIRRHYYANREKYIEKNRKRRIEMRKYVNNLKNSSPCKDCKKTYPYYVMDFDHLFNKKFTISKLVNSNNFMALKNEIDKCEVVCSNCHRIRTHKRILNKTSSNE